MTLTLTDVRCVPSSSHTSYPNTDITYIPWKFAEVNVNKCYSGKQQQDVERKLIVSNHHVANINANIKHRLLKLRYEFTKK